MSVKLTNNKNTAITHPLKSMSTAIFNRCNYCGLANVCESLPNTQKAIALLAKKETTIQKNTQIYNNKSAFTAFYAVRSGSVKTVLTDNNNQQQITGFYLPGDILGLDGVSTKQHTNTAITLETTALCEIPFDSFEQLMAQNIQTQRPFITLLSKEINQQQTLFMQQNQKNADQKIAAFIASIATRYKKQGFSESHFALTMPRSDIANYLGLTVETVSRVFTKLVKEHYFKIDKKNIADVDLPKLSQLAQSE